MADIHSRCFNRLTDGQPDTGTRVVGYQTDDILMGKVCNVIIVDCDDHFVLFETSSVSGATWKGGGGNITYDNVFSLLRYICGVTVK